MYRRIVALFLIIFLSLFSLSLADEIIIDDGGTGTSSTGSWSVSSTAGFYGTQSLFSREIGATYTFEKQLNHKYMISTRWTEYETRCIDSQIDIFNGDILFNTVFVDQTQNGSQWIPIGTFTFNDFAKIIYRSRATECSINVDVIKFNRVINGGQILFVWDPNSETDLAGYRFYQSTQSRVYVKYSDDPNTPNLVGTIPAGTETFTLPELEPGLYYWVVTAYDSSGNESDFSSNEESVIIIDGFPGRIFDIDLAMY